MSKNIMPPLEEGGRLENRHSGGSVIPPHHYLLYQKMR